jgi:hypothetical protein
MGNYMYLMKHLTCPTRITNALMPEKFIDTYSMFARIGATEINLLMTTLASESWRTSTSEVCY